MLSIEDFNSISNASNGQYHLDLSAISKDLFNPILHAIETFGTSLFEILTISCIKLSELSDEIENGQKCYPQYILDSIAINIPQYLKYIINKLNELFSSSRKLLEIHFIFLKCDSDDLTSICKHARRSPSLKLIDFTGIPIGNKEIKEMTYHLSFNKEIQYVYFRRCDLTDKSIPFLVDYVTSVRKRFKHEGLIEIDLSDNDISPQQFSLVVKALNNFTDFEETEEEKLENENEKLREEILKMKEIIREVKEKGKLFIIGDGSDEVIKLMKSIDQRISILEK